MLGDRTVHRLGRFEVRVVVRGDGRTLGASSGWAQGSERFVGNHQVPAASESGGQLGAAASLLASGRTGQQHRRRDESAGIAGGQRRGDVRRVDAAGQLDGRRTWVVRAGGENPVKQSLVPCDQVRTRVQLPGRGVLGVRRVLNGEIGAIPGGGGAFGQAVDSGEHRFVRVPGAQRQEARHLALGESVGGESAAQIRQIP